MVALKSLALSLSITSPDFLKTKIDSSLYTLRFQTRIFFMFSLYKPMQNIWAHFWPQGHYLNKVSRGLQNDATYQKARL